MAKIRINKYLADLGLGSRRKVDEFIEQGLVEVNNQPAELGMKIDPAQDTIKFKDKVVSAQQNEAEPKEYWKLYKPAGVISTVDDPGGRKTVLDLIDSAVRLYPVGRLDQESEGLILLTNDGQLSYHLTHPKFEIEKDYLVWVNGHLTDKDIERMEKGVLLSEGRTQPAQVEIIFREPNRAKFLITITEGRNHQVRRMAARVGLTVTRLKRVRMGNLKLDELQPGEAVRLSKQELHELGQLVNSVQT
jgi:pseudouridine synthase